MSIRKLSLCFILTLLGVMFIAPSASAESADDVYADIIEHFELDSSEYVYQGYIDSYWVTFHGDIKSGRVYFVADSSLSFYDYSTNQNGCSFRIRNLYTYENYTRINDVSHKDGDETFIYNHFGSGGVAFSSPFTWNGDTSPLTTINANYEDWQECGIPGEISQYIDYNQTLPPVENVNLTHIRPVLTSYLESKGWSVAGAYLADSNLSQTKPLNIVTDYNDLPAEYEGLYCLRSSTVGLYKFSVALTPGADPNDYSDYWDDYLVVVFNTSDLTNVTCYFGCAYPQSAHPLALKIGTANWVTNITTTPMTIFGDVFRGVAIGTAFNESQSTQIRLAVRWRYNNTSAIPQPQISPLYVGFDYSNEVNGTVVDGNGSTEYNDYETNYYTTIYQDAAAGLTGTITGRTSFSGSWTGESPDTTIDYDDHMTFDDEAGFGDFFQDIWQVGDGYFTTLLLSVLAVAFAAYLIYGRS